MNIHRVPSRSARVTAPDNWTGALDFFAIASDNSRPFNSRPFAFAGFDPDMGRGIPRPYSETLPADPSISVRPLFETFTDVCILTI